MKLRNIQLHTLISLLLSLLLLVAVLPSGWAEGDPIQDPQAGIGEETTAPEGSAAAESVPGQSDWETRLLLMLQEHDANPDTIAAGYYNLATGEEHYYNGDQYRVSGSMYKVPLPRCCHRSRYTCRGAEDNRRACVFLPRCARRR